MRVVPLQGGVSRTLRDVPTSNGGIPRWSPDGAWIYYTDASGGLSRVPSDGGPPQIITEVDTAGGDRSHFAVDPLPGSRAVYHVLGPDDPRIQAVDVETDEIKDLTAGRHPRYSTTGHLLFQHATEAILLAAAFDVERLELTSAPLPLAEALMPVGVNPGNFAVSRTGRLVYRIGGGDGRVAPAWVGRDGLEEVLDPTFVGAFQVPRVSPDGRKVAVQNTTEGSAQPQIWIYDLDQETFSPLTFEGTNTRPFWSPGGAEVGFLSDRDGERAVYAQAWDRSGEARLLRAGSGAPIFQAHWTPDARWLVYEAQTPGSTINGGDLYYAAPHPDSAAVTILNTPFQEGVPSVSPDGRWLEYQSNESGQLEVYVRPFPGPGGVRPVSVDGGITPVWAHNGREIVGEFKRSSQHLRKEEELRWRQASADGRIELCVRRWVHPVVPRWSAGSIGRGFGKKLLEGCRARSRRWQPACLPLLGRAGFANVVACHLSVFVLCRGATYRSSSEKRLRFFKPAVVAYVRSPGSCAAHRRRSRENCGGTQQREVETSSIEPRPPNGMPIGERSVRKLPNSLRTAN